MKRIRKLQEPTGTMADLVTPTPPQLEIPTFSDIPQPFEFDNKLYPTFKLKGSQEIYIHTEYICQSFALDWETERSRLLQGAKDGKWILAYRGKAGALYIAIDCFHDWMKTLPINAGWKPRYNKMISEGKEGLYHAVLKYYQQKEEITNERNADKKRTFTC